MLYSGVMFPLLATAAVFLGCWLAILAVIRIFDGIAAELPLHLRDDLTDAVSQLVGRRVDGPHALVRIFALAIAFSVYSSIATGSLQVALIVAVLLAIVPVLLLRRSATRFQKELARTLPPALQQVANEMSARPSLEGALGEVARTSEFPANEELLLLQRNIETLGLEAALKRTTAKLNNQSFSLMAAVLDVGGRRGGKLAAALKNLSQTLIEIERLNRKIETATRAARNIFIALSVIGGLIIFGSFFMPGAASVFDSTLGRLAVVVSVLLYVGGVLVARRMVKISV